MGKEGTLAKKEGSSLGRLVRIFRLISLVFQELLGVRLGRLEGVFGPGLEALGG